MIKLIRFLTCHSNMFSYISHMSCIFFRLLLLLLVVHFHGIYILEQVWYVPPRAVPVFWHRVQMVTQEWKWYNTFRYGDMCCVHCCHTVFMDMIVVRSMTVRKKTEEKKTQKIDHFIDTCERTNAHVWPGRKHDHETVITAKMLPKSRDHHN